MTIQDFADTDTALIDFRTGTVSETREISENLYVDIDAEGSVLSKTIEHAKQTGALDEVVYREVKRETVHNAFPDRSCKEDLTQLTPAPSRMNGETDDPLDHTIIAGVGRASGHGPAEGDASPRLGIDVGARVSMDDAADAVPDRSSTGGRLPGHMGLVPLAGCEAET